MSQQKFIDRKEEIEFLEERYKSDPPEFVILNGSTLRPEEAKRFLLLSKRTFQSIRGIYSKFW